MRGRKTVCSAQSAVGSGLRSSSAHCLLPAAYRRRGFTLLELVVVIFIMVLLASLAVASFHRFLDTERIRLAGGSVDSAIRMARQYAMSKRTKCMVEFVSPSDGTSGVVTLSPLQITFVRDGNPYYNEVQAPGSMAAKTSSSGTDIYNRRGFVKFDLSALDVAGASTVTINSATLKLSIATIGTTAGSVDIKSVAVDTWDQSTITWNTQPAAGGNIANVSVPAVGDYDADVTTYISSEFSGDKRASMRLSVPTVNGAIQHFGITATLEVDRTVVMPSSGAAAELIPRQVRIIPYRRIINTNTGGFTWLLDQDANALSVMELPRNIHFILAPAMLGVTQYDPALGTTSGRKQFLVLEPDGSCSAEAPDVPDDPVGTNDHWSGYTNTIILRDTNNDDLCLLYVPPATSFTRQRYLFAGTELDDFEAAHAPYALW